MQEIVVLAQLFLSKKHLKIFANKPRQERSPTAKLGYILTQSDGLDL